MSKQRLAILITSGIGILATFLPWIQAPIVGAINGTKGDGWITCALFTVTLIATLVGNRKKNLKEISLLLVIIPSIVAGIIGFWKVVDFNSAMSGMEDNPFAEALGSAVSIGIGLYLVIISGFLIPLFSFLIKDKQSSSFIL